MIGESASLNKNMKIVKNSHNFHTFWYFNPLTARVFTVFGHTFIRLLEDIVLHKEAWVAKLLGTHFSIHVHKKFSRRDNSSLAVKGLNYQLSTNTSKSMKIVTLFSQFLYFCLKVLIFHKLNFTLRKIFTFTHPIYNPV